MTSEKLSEKCNQEPLLEFEGYVIRPLDPWNLFIENPIGEGATVLKAHFLNVLDKLFKSVF